MTARVEDDERRDRARRGSTSRGSPRSSRRGRTVRLRGRLGRYGFDVKSYDVGAARATADFAPVYPASEGVPSTRLRELARAALAQHGRFLPDPLPAELELPLRCDALAAVHFPRDRGAGGGGAAAARARRARHATARRCALARRRRRSRRRSARRASSSARYRDLLPFQLTEHQERGDRGDRRRSRPDRADAAAAAGRRRLGQDRRRALRACCARSSAGGRAR